MNMLDGFETDIIKIDDLEKIQKMHGLEDEINNFKNKVKELVDAMQKKIKEENEKKLQKIKVLVPPPRNQRRSSSSGRRRPNASPSPPSNNSKSSARTSSGSTTTASSIRIGRMRPSSSRPTFLLSRTISSTSRSSSWRTRRIYSGKRF